MILRLKFETDGVVYNLGVVDCKQTGSSDPVNKGSHIEVSPGSFISEIQSWFESVKDVLKWVLIAIAGVLVLIVLGGSSPGSSRLSSGPNVRKLRGTTERGKGTDEEKT